MEVLSPDHYVSEYNAKNGEATAHILSTLHTFPFHLHPPIDSGKTYATLLEESFDALGADVKGVDIVSVAGLPQSGLRELTYSIRTTLEQQFGKKFGTNPAQNHRAIKGSNPGFWAHFDDILYRRKAGYSFYLPRQMDPNLTPEMNQVVWANFRTTAAHSVLFNAREMTTEGIQAKKSLDLFYAGNYPVGITKDQKALVLTE